jgi:predicted DNA-binding protein (MmcQ/YjbR family)
MNKRHWNTVVLDGTIADAEIYGMINDSYAYVLQGLPKAKWPVP